MAYLKFIEDKDLIKAVSVVIEKIEKVEKAADNKLYKNVIDPFSALFDGVTHYTTFDKWILQEKMRQRQKTMQNAIGDFHQDILGAIVGWKDLGAGGGLDILNKDLKIVAEIKNKFNTTKGNHKIEIYDSIKAFLAQDDFKDFTGYFVEIIPKNKQMYDKPFIPPDNKTKKKRPLNRRIRVIDGKSFYSLATGREFALQELFEVLPSVILEHWQYKFDEKEAKKYLELFGRAFSTR